MKNKLNIFSNDKMQSFLRTFLYEYEIIFMKLESFDYKLQNSQANLIFINNDKDIKLINFKKLKDNNLIICGLKNINFNLSNEVKILNTPLSINHIKHTIYNFLQGLKIEFHDVCIDNEKLINMSNDYFCYLTKIECEILKYLICEKETKKSFIKENILNIKSSIETNSLESHLTRIRKKMNKIKTNLRIQTKNEKLLITF